MTAYQHFMSVAIYSQRYLTKRASLMCYASNTLQLDLWTISLERLWWTFPVIATNQTIVLGLHSKWFLSIVWSTVLQIWQLATGLLNNQPFDQMEDLLLLTFSMPQNITNRVSAQEFNADMHICLYCEEQHAGITCEDNPNKPAGEGYPNP